MLGADAAVGEAIAQEGVVSSVGRRWEVGAEKSISKCLPHRVITTKTLPFEVGV